MNDDVDVVVADEVADLSELAALGWSDEHDQAFVIWDMRDKRMVVARLSQPYRNEDSQQRVGYPRL